MSVMVYYRYKEKFAKLYNYLNKYMKRFNNVSVAVSAIIFLFGLAGSVAHAATAPDLGIADSYAVWGKAGVTNDVGGSTHIWGNVGADLLTDITNLDDATQVDGSIIAPAPGVETAISNAYDDLSTPPQEAATSISLSGTVTVTPGVYTVLAGETLNGTVTLDGAGVYVFRSASAFTVGSNAHMHLTNGACASNVFWQIYSSMTIGTGAEMVGTIITSQEAITFGTGATLQGRAFSGIAAVTLLSNQITEPTCAADEDEEDRDVDIEVVKTADPSILSSGPGSVTFTYKVRNEGNVPLKNISVKDDKCSPVKYISGDGDHDSKLDTNERWLYTCTKVVSQTETNKVTAKGTHGKEVSDTDTAKVVVSVPGFPNAGIGPDDNLWDTIFQKLFSFFSF